MVKVYPSTIRIRVPGNIQDFLIALTIKICGFGQHPIFTCFGQLT